MTGSGWSRGERDPASPGRRSATSGIRPRRACRCPGPAIEVISAEAAPASVTGLDEADFSRVGDHLVARYGISMVDPGASSVAGVLGIADQLVLVAPASADAPRAVSMTHEWLASHE